MLKAIVKSVRPHQWVKNLFVALPLVFARRINDVHADLRAGAAVLIFCLLSSAVYLVNDLVDLEKDRAHPVKRKRPLAAGDISPDIGRAFAAILAVGSLGAAWALGEGFAAIAASYLVLNMSYSLWLKHIAFVDVACISLGFLLRVLGGAMAIPVPPSRWLLVCTLLLSALLGFGKRLHELRMGGARSSQHREVLGSYNPRALRGLLVALSIATTAAYFAYTRSTHAGEVFGAGRLVLTVPFAAFGVARFIIIVGRHEQAESPTDSMLRDIPFVVNLVLYAIVAVAMLYLRS